MTNSFFITGMPRSGTRFLAENMNMSTRWTVKHEVRKRRDITTIQRRFKKDFYGEVSAYLLPFADKISCAKRGIILRSPVQIWLSLTAWHNVEKYPETLDVKWTEDLVSLTAGIPRIFDLIETGKFHVISFEHAVNEIDYLESVFGFFGINDVAITQKMLDTKINAKSDWHITRMEDFDRETIDQIMRLEGEYANRMLKYLVRQDD